MRLIIIRLYPNRCHWVTLVQTGPERESHNIVEDSVSLSNVRVRRRVDAQSSVDEDGESDDL